MAWSVVLVLFAVGTLVGAPPAAGIQTGMTDDLEGVVAASVPPAFGPARRVEVGSDYYELIQRPRGSHLVRIALYVISLAVVAANIIFFTFQFTRRLR